MVTSIIGGSTTDIHVTPSSFSYRRGDLERLSLLALSSAVEVTADEAAAPAATAPCHSLPPPSSRFRFAPLLPTAPCPSPVGLLFPPGLGLELLLPPLPLLLRSLLRILPPLPPPPPAAAGA